MRALLLSDFGSTFTKLCAVDPEREEILGTAAAYTTIESDIFEGFEKALGILEKQVGKLDIIDHKACSSAAGGLRMVVSGLVPELTAEAAKLAALGAGAKVTRVFHHELTDDDLDEIAALKPDIFLLTGGTDGGNQNCILANAEALVDIHFAKPIVVAGNRSCNRKIRHMFEQAGLDFEICENVMPGLNQINIKPAQDEIRKVFLDQIVEAKGLSRIKSMISDIMLPTPAAMLTAMELLADGHDSEPGIGDLLGVDLGGATTDIYSIADGLPETNNTIMKGLKEPRSKRTVEGDIGMRYSLKGIVDAVGLPLLAERAGVAEEDFQAFIDIIHDHKDHVPTNPQEQRIDEALAASAIGVAVERHCGSLEEVFTPMGKGYVQTGKDLRKIEQLVLTGGAIVHSPRAQELARFATWSEGDGLILKPQKVQVLLDRKYILSAMGVLSQTYPAMALRIMKKELHFA